MPEFIPVCMPVREKAEIFVRKYCLTLTGLRAGGNLLRQLAAYLTASWYQHQTELPEQG
jgi:hypothetical protein